MKRIIFLFELLLFSNLLFVLRLAFFDYPAALNLSSQAVVQVVISHLAVGVCAAVGGRFGLMISAILFIFFLSRVAILTNYPTFYVYGDNHTLSSFDLEQAISLLTYSIFGSVIGVLFGRSVARKKTGKYVEVRGFPFADHSPNLWTFVCLAFVFIILSKIANLLMFFLTGAGLPLPRFYFPIEILRAQKAINFFGYFIGLPGSFLIWYRPKGYARALAILCVVLYFLALAPSLSKVMMIQAVMPFILVYFVSEREMSKKLIWIASGLVVATFVFAGLFLAKLRVFLAGVYEGRALNSINSTADFRYGMLSLDFQTGLDAHLM